MLGVSLFSSTPTKAYNAAVPTPFNHIVLAERVLADPALPSAVQRALRSARPAFLLGNTAPDLGSVTGARRAMTHFFDVPMRDHLPAYFSMFRRHPETQPEQVQSPDQAAFLAGYAAHLWLDQAWITAVFEPYFGMQVRRATFHQRLIDHNLLRAHLDRLDRPALPADLADQLAQAQPAGWLPFADDQDIRLWRDHLLAQVTPGGHTRTVEVFAAKSGISRQEFAQELDSKETLQARVLSQLPDGLLQRFWREGLDASVQIVAAYMLGDLQAGSESARRVPAFSDLSEMGIRERP